MKKLLVILILCSSNFINAQNYRYGIKGGLNASTLLGTETKVNTKMGFHLGGLAEVRVSEELYIQPELLFSVLGANQYIGDVNNDIRLTYVTIPLVAKYYINGGLCIEAGPYASFNIGGTKGKGDSKVILEDINAIDYGGSVGINYIMQNSLSFGIRVNVGASDIYDNYKGNNEVKNLFPQLTIAYFL